MRKIVASAALVGGLAIAAAAQASVIESKLVATQVGSTNQFTVDVLVKVSGVNGAGGDGGLSGTAFQITSLQSNQSDVDFGGPPAKTTMAWVAPVNSTNFSLIAPTRSDITGDGDQDLKGASISDTGNFTATTVGLNAFQKIASVTWTLRSASAQDDLQLTLDTPTAYNYNAADTNYQEYVTTVIPALPVHIAVPEPTSLSLLALGGLALRRRRA